MHSAFVVFENQEDAKLCLKKYKKFQGFFGKWKSQPEDLKFRGDARLKVKKATDASEIMWENVEDGKCSQWSRKAWSTTVAGFLLFMSASAIYSIKIYQDTLPETGNCYKFANTYIETINPRIVEAVDCFCTKQSYSDLTADAKIRSFCFDYMKKSTWRFVITFAAAEFVYIMNVVVRGFLKKLSRFERFYSLTKLNVSIMTKLFFAFFINMGLLIVIINANLNEKPVIREAIGYIPVAQDLVFNGDYEDLTRDWYINVGVPVITMLSTTIIVRSIVPFAVLGIKAYQRNFLWRKRLL